MNRRMDFCATHHQNGRNYSWDELLDLAVVAYWTNRPRTPRCGSVQGYYQHLHAKTPPCEPCKKARRMVVAIQRHRARTAA